MNHKHTPPPQTGLSDASDTNARSLSFRQKSLGWLLHGAITSTRSNGHGTVIILSLRRSEMFAILANESNKTEPV